MLLDHKANSQTHTASLVHQTPAVFLPHFYKGHFSVIAMVWWQLWYLIVCLFFSVWDFLYIYKIVACEKKSAAQFDSLNVQLQQIWIHNTHNLLPTYSDMYNYVHLCCPLPDLEELQQCCVTLQSIIKLKSYYCQCVTWCPPVYFQQDRTSIYLKWWKENEFLKNI